MFEKPSGPRSGSLEKRLQAYNSILPLSKLSFRSVENLTAKEAREALYETRRVAALLERVHGIRIEQSHKVAVKAGVNNGRE